LIAEGLPTCHACALARLNYNTVRTWLNPKHKQYRASLDADFKAARATAVLYHLGVINESKDWRAHAWWLQRNVPEYAPPAHELKVRSLHLYD
jgi:hypothetical protein